MTFPSGGNIQEISVDVDLLSSTPGVVYAAYFNMEIVGGGRD